MELNGSRQPRLTETREESACLKLKASLCCENALDVIESIKNALFNSRTQTVLVDLSEVQLVDSAGLRALLEARQLCEEAGGHLQIGPMSEAAARVIALSGLEEALGVEVCQHSEKQLVEDTSFSRKSEVELQVGRDDCRELWNVSEYLAPSEPSVISDLRDKVTAAAQLAGAEGDVLCDIQIAVGEALTNAYAHGSPQKGLSKILVRCLTCPGAVVVEITDEGCPFDHNLGAKHDPSSLRDHGMGLYLMRQAMDVVEFASDCPGNRVRMIKWLSKK